MRTHLRNSTAIAHAQLDTFVGEFTDLPRYQAYLRGLHSFRAPLEALIRGAVLPSSYGNWRPHLITKELQKDLEDLGLAVPEASDRMPRTGQSESWWAGTLYVLEGSAVGARLLYRRAQALGLSGEHGARHLAAQDGQRDAWPTFLRLIEQPSNIDVKTAGEAAQRAFAHALQAFTERANDYHC